MHKALHNCLVQASYAKSYPKIHSVGDLPSKVFFINILVLYVQKLNQTENVLWRVLQTEKSYFAPAENFHASHSFPNAPPPYSGAALRPACPTQLHVCHSTSSIPSRSPEQQNRPVCAHSRALRCSSAPPIGVLKQECLGAAGLCSPRGAPHRSASSMHTGGPFARQCCGLAG